MNRCCELSFHTWRKEKYEWNTSTHNSPKEKEETHSFWVFESETDVNLFLLV